jgi:hypothetical protein
MSGLVFLFKDTGKPNSRRLWYALGVRITFATLLLMTIGYGFYTGELRMGLNAPWQGASAGRKAGSEEGKTGRWKERV